MQEKSGCNFRGNIPPTETTYPYSQPSAPDTYRTIVNPKPALKSRIILLLSRLPHLQRPPLPRVRPVENVVGAVGDSVRVATVVN